MRALDTVGVALRNMGEGDFAVLNCILLTTSFYKQRLLKTCSCVFVGKLWFFYVSVSSDLTVW